MGGDDYLGPGPWELHNNWRRLLGFDLRRYVYHSPLYGGWRWQYARSKKVAREMLHSAYAPTGQKSSLTFD